MCGPVYIVGAIINGEKMYQKKNNNDIYTKKKKKKIEAMPNITSCHYTPFYIQRGRSLKSCS